MWTHQSGQSDTERAITQPSLRILCDNHSENTARIAFLAELSGLWREHNAPSAFICIIQPLILSLFLPLALSLQARNIIMGDWAGNERGIAEE